MASRNKRKPTNSSNNENSPLASNKRVENSWILLGTGSLFKNDNFSIITLPHPANGNAAKYCLDDLHSKMYEIVKFDEPYRSWFLDEKVKSDGSIMMLSPVNPTFLILPRLREQCVSRAIPLEDLLSEKGFVKICDIITDLNHVADLKGPPDMKAYKYNEEKALAWLKERVQKLAQLLKDKNIHVRSGAVSATFVASNIDNNSVHEEFYLKYAHGMISEYLEQDLAEALEKQFDFKPELIESLSKKRKSEADNQNVNKKVKSEENGSKENSFIENIQSTVQTKKEKPLSAKEKSRQKAASGTKTISSFFTKK